MYIDFDNFFGGLMAADPASAVDVATNPSRWLQRLTHTHADENERRWLALRCYMNPSGWVANPRVETERLYFSRFRPYFVRAGFEVVDCPTLARGKNAADIRIVIDVMNALQGPAPIEEFLLASSDADFTPLLHVVRAHDRLVTMIATGETAMAYEALADRVLGPQAVLDLLALDASDVGDPAEALDGGSVDPAISPTNLALRDAFAAEVNAQYAAAIEPINLARAATRIVAQLGDDLRTSNWLGAGSFVRAVRTLNLPNVAFSQHHMWDTSRHTPPDQAMSVREIPPEIAKFCQVTGLPYINQDDWPRVFGYLEEYVRTQDFNLTDASKWPRDRSADQGHPIARAVFLYVVTSCHSQGTRLDVAPKPTAHSLAAAVCNNVLARAELAGLDLSDSDIASLRSWLGVSDGMPAHDNSVHSHPGDV